MSSLTLRRAATATVSAFALLLTVPSAALAGGGTAEVDVQHDCTSVSVTSSKDISNVVLAFADGDHQKHDGLSGRSGTFRGTSANAGEVITTAWVKSGNNKSGDGPGYGERFDFSTDDCDASTEDDGYPTGGSTEPAADEKQPNDETPQPDDETTSDDDETTSASAAAIQVSGTCDAVRVTSSKDISNVVLAHLDGTHQKFDGLSGRSGTFRATAGRTIATVWVKSGNNHSGDGPGYGERFDLPTDTCGTDGPDADQPVDDTPNDDNPGDDTPGDDTPNDDNPGNDTPGNDTPGNDTPGNDNPSNDDPSDDNPGVGSNGDPTDEDATDDEGEVLNTGQERPVDTVLGTPWSTEEPEEPQGAPEVLGVVLDREPAPALDTDVTTADDGGIGASILPNTGATGLPAALAVASIALLLGAGLVRRGRVA